MPAGRPRTFNAEASLPLIMKIFWKNGFDGVTLEKVARDIGVTKPTLCNAFGDKDAIFAQTLDCYYRTYGIAAEKALTEGQTFKDSLFAWFRVSIDRILDPDTPCGCFLTDTATSGKFSTGAVTETLSKLQCRTLPLLADCIEQAKKTGEFRTDLETMPLVQYLASQQAALSALSRNETSRDVLEAFVHFALEGLPWSDSKPNTL